MEALTDMKVLLCERIHPAAEAAFHQAGLRVERRDGALEGASPSELAGTAILGIRSKTEIDAATIERLPDLLAIGCFCIGTNQVDLRAAMRRAVTVFNAPFSNTRSVAELTLAEVVALNRRLVDKSMLMHGGRWDKSSAGAHEVRGRTLGIIGYGHIGSQVSVLAEAFGMRVVYFDIVQRLPLGNAQPRSSLSDVLREADCVSLHVPATPATHNLIGAAEIATMKPGAMIINNARGSVVDLHAAAAALQTGHLGGIAADVFPEEPALNDAPFACPLAGLPNVILTPHVGGSTEEAQRNIAVEVSEKLARFVRTGTTTSSVNVPEVDLPSPLADQLRILHFHRNVPGVLSRINGIMADLGVNINAEYLRSNAEVSYVILDVDPVPADVVETRLSAIPETIRVRTIHEQGEGTRRVDGHAGTGMSKGPQKLHLGACGP